MTLSWKNLLADRISPENESEFVQFETLMALRKRGTLEEKVFAEARLRLGAYGQRYDNGKRHDGVEARNLGYSSITKGPETFWDAPGMQRIKIPFGGLNSAQMRLLADLAEEYADHILHITTRQDVQLHYVQLDDAPDIFRRLSAVGITTREACGNAVRNVTACPKSGVCRTEPFDATPYAKAIARYLLGHPDCQDFGRKFKIAFSGCSADGCGLVYMHDLGAVAKIQTVNGVEQRGFEVYVGGGLGAVPHKAKLLKAFVPENELLPISRAVCRVFAKLGEKKNRQKARLKFVVAKLGIEEFIKVVDEEYKTMPHDPLADQIFSEIPKYRETPNLVPLNISIGKKPVEADPDFDAWRKANVYEQRQSGYAMVTVPFPLGDVSPAQFRILADITRDYCGDNARTTVEQNLVLRWIPVDKLPEVHKKLKAIGLATPCADTVLDIVSCPGTDTCKLGIASSRGLAAELRNRLAPRLASLPDAIRDLRVKVSGCFNSCGQHHVADIGFFGNTRLINGYNVPHFQVVLGGKWRDNGGSYGVMIGSIPSRRIPDLLDALTQKYIGERTGDSDTFQDWCQRVGKKNLKDFIDPFAAVPPYSADPAFYQDWGDPRNFSVGDRGEGECAGEAISPTQFGFSAAESRAFEAQLSHEKDLFQEADQKAYEAMLLACATLLGMIQPNIARDADVIVSRFKTEWFETKLFWDPYVGGQFANYLFTRHEGPDARYTADTAGN